MQLTTNHKLHGSVSHLSYWDDGDELTLHFDDESRVEVTTVSRTEIMNFVRNFVCCNLKLRTDVGNLTKHELLHLRDVCDALLQYLPKEEETKDA